MMTHNALASVVEVVVFKLADHANEAAFLAEFAQPLQALLPQFAGFQKRQLLKSEQGYWVDMVWWESMEQATAAAETFQQHSLAQHFGQFVVPDSVLVLHTMPTTLS
jgi:hypothetical protein